MLEKRPNRRSFQVFDVDDTSRIHEVNDFVRNSSNGCRILTKIHGVGFNSEYSMILKDGTNKLYDVNPGAKIIKNNKKEVCVLTEEQYKILFT